MDKQFGVITDNVLVNEVSKSVKNNQRTFLIGSIVRIERTVPEGNYAVRLLKDSDGRDSWDTIHFSCPRANCQIVPEKLWPFLAAVQSPIERAKMARNKERYEKLLQISVDMVVGYTEKDNINLGIVKYIGNVKSIGKCFGILLHEKKPHSRCNGSIANMQYFTCLPGYGVFSTIDCVVAHNVLNSGFTTKALSPQVTRSTAVINIPEVLNALTTPIQIQVNKLSSGIIDDGVIKPQLKSHVTSVNKASHNATSGVTSSLENDGVGEGFGGGITSSMSMQQLLLDEVKDSVNTNNDFDHNTILQPDRLGLIDKKKVMRSSVAGIMRNGSEHNSEKLNNLSDTKTSEAYLKLTETNNVLTAADRSSLRSQRNKSFNPISHMISGSKTVPKKGKLPTFKSYEPELNSEARRALVEVQASQERQRSGGLVAQYIEPDPALTNDITVGTLVQIGQDGGADMLYGVVRWLGMEIGATELSTHSPASPTIVAGIELDDDDDPPPYHPHPLCDGTFAGERRFHCAGNTGAERAIFVPLSVCTRDSRFMDGVAVGAGAGAGAAVQQKAGGSGGGREGERDRERRERAVKEKLFGAEKGKPVIEGSVAPLIMKTEEDVKAICTKFRGIQGHHNSCYLDATLFSMFTFTSVFDSLLFRPKGPNDIPQYDEVQRVLREEIVNPLRTNLFVNADRVMTLRRLLDQLSSVSGLTSEEKDPEEFLNSLLAQILRAEPFLKLNSGQESYYYQLFVEKDDRLKLPTVQQLFEQSFHTSEIKLKEVPSCLIIQMPRFGKSYKMYPRILPSQLLDVTDIIENSPRGCSICGSLALYECTDCYSETTSDESTLENTAFCAACVDTCHRHIRRAEHRPRRLQLPPDYLCLAEHGPAQPTRLYMELFAVVCIETSHYVAFVKCGEGHVAPWCFFDSMADREGEKNGYNIPEMVACPDVAKWLSDEQSCRSLHKDSPLDRHLPEHARRLLCDAYICMYQSSDVMMYR